MGRAFQRDAKQRPDAPVGNQGTTADLDIDTNPPSKQEVVSAIKTLKNGEASGLDNLNAELFKADPNLAAEILLPLFTEICKQEKIPLYRTKGVISKIPRKGGLSEHNN